MSYEIYTGKRRQDNKPSSSCVREFGSSNSKDDAMRDSPMSNPEIANKEIKRRKIFLDE
ncbi:hypothetical protein PHLCEN_2v5466 [Hermanssonia centrifuga]|uniref:Uncharacterized protein n=1 Tax=Hermanssonia centrifuga TaxID=98765 RepID=A0A2R6P2D8_9APHY|nr:hypothetical protein PHLCEN_2v5466 [Hermanssonia centrifuga]